MTTAAAISPFMPDSSGSTHVPFEGGTASVLFTALRIFGLLVLALMLASILYSGWISLENWGTISV